MQMAARMIRIHKAPGSIPGTSNLFFVEIKDPLNIFLFSFSFTPDYLQIQMVCCGQFFFPSSENMPTTGDLPGLRLLLCLKSGRDDVIKEGDDDELYLPGVAGRLFVGADPDGGR